MSIGLSGRGQIFGRTEVIFPDGHEISGAVLSDQVKSIDWRVRNAKLISRAPEYVLDEVLAKMLTLLNTEMWWVL